MKAHLHSARIAPKKANLIAKMVRGMPVPAAMIALQNTHKKGARYIEQLLRSAVANAEHNDKQKTDEMVIKTIVVNQGTAYRRGMPKARGQTRPFKKFLTHITIELGLADSIKPAKKARSSGSGQATTASKSDKSAVKTPTASAGKAKTSTKKSESSSSSSAA
jgi:large subunit ribosomal protein L22